MNDGSQYTSYHPRWLRTRVSTYWWLERTSYLLFILRELSSVFVAWFVLYLLLLVRAVGLGPERYESFVAWSASPVVLTVNVIAFVFVVYHAITWFNLAPQAMVVRVRGKRVPGTLIAASQYAGWLAVSAVIAWLLLGGGP